jgi:hypothetical protein
LKILVFLLLFQLTFCQDFKYTGKIIGQDLLPLPAIVIANENDDIIAQTDFEGHFEIVCPVKLSTLRLSNIGYQSEQFELKINCFNIEIILLENWIYDFISLKKADKKLKRDRKKIIRSLYNEAYEKKIFKAKDCSLELQY